MGARNNKKRDFLKNNPICYMCGLESATTQDHVPARICFINKDWPDGFVFPACEKCNAKDRDSEIVVAFHIHAATGNNKDFEKVYNGIRNNYPSTLPNPFMTIGEKAKALSRRGISLPANKILVAPVVKISPDVHEHFHRFGRKLAKALYYKEFSRPAATNFRIITHWLIADTPESNNILDSIIELMPKLEIGQRLNADIGNQFAYRFNVSSSGEFMMQTSNFSDKVFITSIGGTDRSEIDFEQFLNQQSWREFK